MPEFLQRAIARIAYVVGRGTFAVGAQRLSCSLFALATAVHADHLPSLRYLAWVLARRQRVDQAIVVYRRLLRIGPRFAEGHFELGQALNRRGRYSEALEEFQTALDLSPRDRAYELALAATLIALRHYSQAIPICQRLVHAKPADATLWGLLGRAYLGMGDWTSAAAAYDRSLSLRQDAPIAAEAAGALMELDRHGDARDPSYFLCHREWLHE